MLMHLINFLRKKSNPKIPYDFVLGYRLWKVQNGKLRSVTEADIWFSQDLFVGKCALGEAHRAATKNCKCGIYALNNLANFRDYEKQYFQVMAYFISKNSGSLDYLRNYHQENTVGGVVLAWGQVSFYEHGFRAEYAMPLALMKGKSQAENMARIYNIPHLGEDDLEIYLNNLNLQNKIFIPSAAGLKNFRNHLNLARKPEIRGAQFSALVGKL